MTFLLSDTPNEFFNNFSSNWHSLSFYINHLLDVPELGVSGVSLINLSNIDSNQLNNSFEFDSNNLAIPDVLPPIWSEEYRPNQLLSNFISFIENSVLTYPETKIFIVLLRFVLIFILNILGYFYIITKFYRVICYAKMTFEWLPMINPYEWPVSFFLTLAEPYFLYWSKLLPNLKTSRSTIEISSIIALEGLNVAGIFTVKLTNLIVLTILESERILSL